ncbi:MAG: response regulator transcription factor [Chitinophagaceae bacterium]|nr:response regulator transcription factor [Chitinophagaceae bacterium]
MIKIYITEDHEMYLEGLALLLRKQPEIEIAGTSLNASGLLAALPSLKIDVLLLDVHLPDMEEEALIKQIRELRPDLLVIYLTLMRGTRYIHKLLKYNIQGYVLKNAPVEELYTAIRTVCNGGTYFSDEINIMAKDDFRDTITLEDHKVEAILSKREIEVLQLVCMEFSNTQIAEKLFLSISTIETHRKNLISKLGVNNTVGLVKFALKNKLIK